MIGGLLLLSLLASLIASIGPWQTTLSHAHDTTPPQQIIYQNSLQHLTSKFYWSISPACPFTSEGLHITAAVACYARVGLLDDGIFTVTVRQVSGATTRWKGIVFRLQDAENFYLFEIDGAGNWLVTKITAGVFSSLSQHASPALRTGIGAPNTLTVQMMGSHFTFSANGTTLGSVDDAAVPLGVVALTGDDEADMLFTDVTISIPSSDVAP
jgi:hypothetical protein